jgi:apolipoprotein N-acyltransferase
MSGRRAAWAIAFALAFGLSFPFRAGELRFDLGPALGWVALLPLAWLLRGLTPGAGLLWASAAASGAFGVALWWIYIVVHVHGQAPLWAGVGAAALLSAALGLHVGVAGALFAWLAPRAGAFRLLLLPSVWVVLEKVRGTLVFGGFPWAGLGYAMHADGPMRELAAVAGVYGLSFALALAAALLAEGRLRSALALFALLHFGGFALGLSAEPEPGVEPLRIGIVQANIPQGEKWDAERAGAAFQAHLDLSEWAAASAELDLILWPETAIPVLLEVDPDARGALSALAERHHVAVVVGGLGIDRPSPGEEVRFFNSSFAIDPSGQFVDRYDKSRLVPFGEYVPARALFGFLDALATGLALSDLTPGFGPRTLGGIPALSGSRSAAPLICYEAIYPELVREAVRGGARLLMNLTNDAWYGRSSAPDQFLAIAAMRAAEHGIPMVRAANTGISAVVDPGGLVRESTPLFEPRALVARVPAPRAGLAPYTRFGDWVVWAGGGLILGIALATRLRRPAGSVGA